MRSIYVKPIQPTTRFMASVTCGLTAEDRDQLHNPALASLPTKVKTYTSVIMEICQKHVTPRVPPFKVTEGHWN